MIRINSKFAKIHQKQTEILSPTLQIENIFSSGFRIIEAFYIFDAYTITYLNPYMVLSDKNGNPVTLPIGTFVARTALSLSDTIAPDNPWIVGMSQNPNSALVDILLRYNGNTNTYTYYSTITTSSYLTVSVRDMPPDSVLSVVLFIV